jgi:HlyD family secretion protein
LLTRQIAESTENADHLRDAGKKALEDRRKALQNQLSLFQKLSTRLEARVERYEKLEKSGVVNKQELLQLEQTTMNTLLTCQSLETQLQELGVGELKDAALDMQRRHRILEMKNQLQDLVRKETQLAHEAAQFTINTDEPVEVLEEEIRILETRLAESTILSPYSGRVLEVTAVQGQVVGAGSRLAVLEIEDPDKPLVAVTCFQIKDGKQVREDLEIRVTPSTVQRARFGSMLGRVTSVGAFPVTSEELSKIVGNRELARNLVPLAGGIVVFGSLQPDAKTPSGYAWSSGVGPPLRPTPGTTTAVRVVVDQRSPLSFVLPILRTSAGVQ